MNAEQNLSIFIYGRDFISFKNKGSDWTQNDQKYVKLTAFIQSCFEDKSDICLFQGSLKKFVFAVSKTHIPLTDSIFYDVLVKDYPRNILKTLKTDGTRKSTVRLTQR